MELRVAIKSKQTSNQLEPVTRNSQLPMHHPLLATVVTQSQMHVQIKHSVAHLATRFNPYFGWCVLHIYFISAKVGIKSCSQVCQRMLLSFVHAFSFELQQQPIQDGAQVAISYDWFKLVTCLLTSYCDPYFLFQILIKPGACLVS